MADILIVEDEKICRILFPEQEAYVYADKQRMEYQKIYKDGIINKTQRHQMFSEDVSRTFAKRFWKG